jgi:hypothetical protein
MSGQNLGWMMMPVHGATVSGEGRCGNRTFFLSGYDPFLNPQKRQVNEEKVSTNTKNAKRGGEKQMGKLPWRAINTELLQALAAIQGGNAGAWAWKVIEGHLYTLSYRGYRRNQKEE